MLPPRPWELFRVIDIQEKVKPDRYPGHTFNFYLGVGGISGRAMEACSKGDDRQEEWKELEKSPQFLFTCLTLYLNRVLGKNN